MRIALILAAGQGRRLAADRPKAYVPLAGLPVLRRSVLAFLRHPEVDGVQVVIDPDHRRWYEQAVGDLSLPPPVMGGASRQESARRGLEALAAQGARQVLIHDAARPLVSGGLIRRVAEALARHAAAAPALPVVDTLRRLEDGRPGAALSRENLLRMQTPQGFAFQSILEAHRREAGRSHSDDVGVALAQGVEVAWVAGEERNVKITTPGDLRFAEELLRASPRTHRTGFGYDVHRFADRPPLVLLGVSFADHPGLLGHSDADVGLHALTDAILATVAAGDIGTHFPPDDLRWRGADSAHFLRRALALLADAGGRLEHVDITLLLERPRIGPRREAMRARLSELLGLPTDRISVKATTSEGLGFVGRGEGVAAYAVATASFLEG